MPSVKLFQEGDASDGLRHLDEPAQERLRALAPAAPAQSLRRTGKRPYAFNGKVLATVCGVTPALPYWYEINVYRTVIDTFVCDTRLFNKSPDLPDLFRVMEADTLDAAFDHLEAYDAAFDLGSVDELGRPGQSPADLALGIARLQMRADAIRAHYASVVADMLKALEPQLS